MRIIIIEDSVFNCNEKLFKEIEIKKEEFSHYTQDLDMSNYLDSIKPKLKFLGLVMFDFRL